VPQLLVSASLKIVKQAQEMLRYGLARDFVEDRTDVTADMGLQGRGQAAGFRRFGPARDFARALVHLVAYARHFSPPILTFRVAVHNRSQEARFGEIYDTGFSELKGAKTPKAFNWFHLLEPDFLTVRLCHALMRF
jgi:hypothetical protein